MMSDKKSPKMMALRELMQELIDSGMLDDVKPEMAAEMPEEGEDYAMRDEEEAGDEEAGDEEGEMIEEPKKIRVSMTRLAAIPREEMMRGSSDKKGKRGRY